MKIRDLKPGDRVAVTYVVPNASRASGTHIRTDAGQTVRIKATMKIEKVV